VSEAEPVRFTIAQQRKVMALEKVTSLFPGISWPNAQALAEWIIVNWQARRVCDECKAKGSESGHADK
jgi:hypothetical protein